MSLVERYTRRRTELEAAGRGAPWVLVFDIDSTLMDTEPRNRAILEAAFDRLPALAPWKGKLGEAPIGWNILGPLAEAGLRDPGLHDLVRAFWKERFFTDEWVRRDEPYPAVAECLRDLKALGFRLVYLTGRHSPGMEEGTRESFLRHGLPAGAEETFFFKPTFDEDDTAFKTRACASIAGLGTVVGTLDNEPANVNLFARVFPWALNLRLDTITTPRPAPLAQGIETVQIAAFRATP